jgi:hypothetical protein
MAVSKYFTLLDIESAYWHIPIHPDQKKGHKPGKKHVNADVLSRHVAAVVPQPEGTDMEGEEEAEISLSKNSIALAQDEDEYCQQILKALDQGERLPYLVDNDQILYY